MAYRSTQPGRQADLLGCCIAGDLLIDRNDILRRRCGMWSNMGGIDEGLQWLGQLRHGNGCTFNHGAGACKMEKCFGSSRRNRQCCSVQEHLMLAIDTDVPTRGTKTSSVEMGIAGGDAEWLRLSPWTCHRAARSEKPACEATADDCRRPERPERQRHALFTYGVFVSDYIDISRER